MQTVLKDVPMSDRLLPGGLIQANGDYYYDENPPGTGVGSLGVPERSTTPAETDKPQDDVKSELF